MIVWHLGTAVLLVYVTLGRRRIDYRYVLAGAIAPDLIDGVLAAIGVFAGPAGRWVAHSLLAAVVAGLVVIFAFRAERRLAVFGLAVGWLAHLACDGMWMAPETFFWPAFGTDFASAPAEPYSWDLLVHPLDHAATWAGEIAGGAILAWFWVAHRLGEGTRFRLFLRDGYLRA